MNDYQYRLLTEISRQGYMIWDEIRYGGAYLCAEADGDWRRVRKSEAELLIQSMVLSEQPHLRGRFTRWYTLTAEGSIILKAEREARRVSNGRNTQVSETN